MLVVQSPLAPGRIRDAVADLLVQGAVALRVASAYTTLAGSKLLLEALEQSVGNAAFAAMPKTLVTCFDFSITEPRALRHWLSLKNAAVHIAGVPNAAAGGTPAPSPAFHPKLYAFDVDDETCNVLVGSANLTSRGFTVNTEVGWAQQAVPAADIQSTFDSLSRTAQPLSATMLGAYEQRYNGQATAVRHPESASVTPFSPPGSLQPLRQALQSGQVNLSTYRAMWVHADALQGGSQNQLELPRGGNQFFGFSFTQYNYPHNLTIGHPQLRRGPKLWTDRPLTWHGNNGMERLNLPTKAQGGTSYPGSVVMFRRLDDGSFELVVTPLGSDLANAWTSASSQTGDLFTLGTRATSRLVGLLH